ncbi:hypothetical protein MCEGEM19_00215 [Candidatus Pelagibacterales bacterium]
MWNFKYIKALLLFLIFFTTLYLVNKEISNFFFQLSDYLKKINYKHSIIAIFFCTLSILCNSLALLTLYRYNTKIDFFKWSRQLYNSYILDHIPFLGLAYRAKKFKQKYNFQYTAFISIHLFAIVINLFLILIVFKFFLLFINFNFFNLEIQLLNFVIVSLFIFLLFICYLHKFKFILLNFENNHVLKKILTKGFFFFSNHTDLLRKKLLLLKFTALIIITHLFNFIFFITIFKIFNVRLDLKFQFIIYLSFAIVNQIKILPKNYVIGEYIGALLISKTSVGFTVGFLIFVLQRFLQLVSILILFFLFNFLYAIKKFKFK